MARPPARGAGDACRVERVGGISRMAALEREWAGLAASAIEANVFYDPAFALPAWRHLEAGSALEWLLVWRGEGRLIGALPVVRGMLGRGLPLKVHKAWTHPQAPLSTPLLLAGEEDAAAAALAGALMQAGGGRSFVQRLAAEGPAQAALDKALNAAGACLGRLAIHRRAVLAGGGEGEAYLRQSLGKKRSKELHRLTARLGEEGAVEFSLAAAPGEIGAAGEDFLALEAAGWKGKRGTALVQRPQSAAFFREALAGLAEKNAVWVVRLGCGGTCAAAAVVLFSGARAWLWKIAYDEAFKRYSPGVLLTCEITRRLLARPDIERSDSCAVANHPMIDHIWRQRIEMADRMAGPGGGLRHGALLAAERGRLAGFGAARSVLHRLRGH